MNINQRSNTYKGIAFPFRFNSRGSVETSELTHTDFSRIIESVHQILFTFKMERIMNLNFGTERGQIFAPMGDITENSILRHNIIQSIEEHEDRVEVNDCRVYADEANEGTIIVELDLHVIKFVKDITVKTNYQIPVVDF